MLTKEDYIKARDPLNSVSSDFIRVWCLEQGESFEELMQDIQQEPDKTLNYLIRKMNIQYGITQVFDHGKLIKLI